MRLQKNKVVNNAYSGRKLWDVPIFFIIFLVTNKPDIENNNNKIIIQIHLQSFINLKIIIHLIKIHKTNICGYKIYFERTKHK